MKLDLKGFTVFLTGGSDGMGFEMSKALLSCGATVVIAARGGKKLDNALSRLREAGGVVYAVPTDVRDEDSVNAAASWFREKFDHLDMLVNNAGIGNNAPGMEGAAHLWDVPTETFMNIVETDFTGYFLVSKAFIPMMLSAGKGRIVNVSTSTGTMTRKGVGPYGPARAGAEAMSHVFAEELREFGVTVNVLCPGGATDTGMATDAMRESFRKGGMKMLPADILNRAILFLASDASAGLSGEKFIGREFEDWLLDRGLDFEA